MRLTEEHVRIAAVARSVTGMSWIDAHRVAYALVSQFEMTARTQPIPIRWDTPIADERPMLTIVPRMDEVQS